MTGRPAPEVSIALAETADAGEVLAVQRAAFSIEAQRYDDPALPPLLETVDEVAAAIAAGQVLLARLDGQVVGSIRRVLTGDEVEIGRLSVLPQVQGRGLGGLLLAAAEDVPGARTALLFTGHLSAGNLGLYHRRGYREFARRRVSERVELVYLRKSLPQ